MALIQCPECHGMVSDKAASCPHCGCPTGKFCEDTNILKCPTCKYEVPLGAKECPICFSKIPSKPQTYSPNLPKCPTCGSTNLDKITAFDRGVAGGLFGFASKTARSQFRCRSCGFMW